MRLRAENVVRMTTLVGDTGQRTFSPVRRYLAGLPGTQPNKAEGQDLADFGDALGDWCVILVERVLHAQHHVGVEMLSLADDEQRKLRFV